jgi:isopentenyl diphosphate isomerase/L-lactate dehydrogenase-like FMN-dependent dehydrogenase
VLKEARIKPMSTSKTRAHSRRQFLRLLAASPLLPHLDLPAGWMIRAQAAQDNELITSAKDAINVFDFEAVARRNLPPAHWGYMAGGSDDDATIAANRDGFTRYQLRMRRLIDVSRLDTSIQLLGAKLDSPILLCPVGGQRMFHRDGEIAVARAARAKKHLQVLSTVGNASIEEVSKERGEPVWFQLYQRNDWDLTRQMLKRAEAAGCPALVFTIDLLGGRNPETYQRSVRRDTRQCGTCHDPAPLLDNRRRPMLADLIPPATPRPELGTPTWDYVKRLKDTMGMKLLLKGIVTREDAELAVEHGVDGLFVSNHGGRAENSLRSTIECVPEVVAGVAGRVPVIVDSGFRRGTDIFKALALGATAVGVGRPYVWGLSAFGQEGVETVLDILQRELQLVMRQAGTTTIKQITRAHVVERRA